MGCMTTGVRWTGVTTTHHVGKQLSHLYAPVTDPGFTKHLPSYKKTRERQDAAGRRTKDLRKLSELVRVSSDENVAVLRGNKGAPR